ncbi:NAD(+)/NADH kinase [Azotosporobacter soli]|uniref:NAD(+)/NADH kinase n=1 Tax=Azotosporobacter soli TaxID=3055040 RepID=UPI0031FF181B
MVMIGLLPNPKKRNITDIIDWLASFFSERNHRVCLPLSVAEKVNRPELGIPEAEFWPAINFAITLGGDGTLLSATRKLSPYGVPVCGVNLGRLGFLTEIETTDLTWAAERLANGDYEIGTRTMLDMSVSGIGDSCCFLSNALNDIVVTKNGAARIARLKVFIDGAFAANYVADGLIVGTATGSTAYAFSAGGPVIHPALPLIQLTPICPHSGMARSLIVPDSAVIEVQLVSGQQDMVATVDGQVTMPLADTDTILIRKSAHVASFIQLGEKSYYHTVRSKLWCGERDADF